MLLSGSNGRAPCARYSRRGRRGDFGAPGPRHADPRAIEPRNQSVRQRPPCVRTERHRVPGISSATGDQRFPLHRPARSRAWPVWEKPIWTAGLALTAFPPPANSCSAGCSAGPPASPRSSWTWPRRRAATQRLSVGLRPFTSSPISFRSSGSRSSGSPSRSSRPSHMSSCVSWRAGTRLQRVRRWRSGQAIRLLPGSGSGMRCASGA
jgi:hypothetical protein